MTTQVPTPSPTAPAVAAVIEHHDLFDVFASLVLPAVTGTATLVVSVVSLVIASNALRLSRRALALEERRENDARRAARVRLKPVLEDWLFHAFVEPDPDPGTEAFSRHVERFRKLDHELGLLNDSSGPRLRTWLSLQVGVALARVRSESALGVDVRSEEFDRVLTGGARVIERWSEDPSTVEQLNTVKGVIEGFRPFVAAPAQPAATSGGDVAS